MSPKKKKRPQAAQALIDELLDESTNSATKADPRQKQTGMSDKYDNEPILLQVDDAPPSFIVSKDPSPLEHSIEADEEPMELDLSLDISAPHQLDPIAKAAKSAADDRNQATQVAQPSRKPVAPFEGTKPLVTQMARREEKSDDPDFGDLSIDQTEAPANALSEIEPEEATMRIKTPPSAQTPSDPDATVAAPSRDIRQNRPKAVETSKSVDRGGATEIRSGLRLAASAPQASAISAASAVFASSEAALKQSESLRIAQNRISELEAELERIRRENEDLAAAGETLRRRADELIGKAESLEAREREAQRIADEERKVMRGQLQAKDRENADLKTRVEEIELRLESNFKKIRVRERELEHRLEIVKMENLTLVSTKDKMILELKRQLDQLVHENDLAKSKAQEMYNVNRDKQETIRRVVRALRIALTILEGDDETVVPLKKAE